MASFHKTHEPLAERLLSHINSCKRVVSSDNVSFEASLQFDGYQNVLQDIISLSADIPQSEFKRIVWRSLVNSAKEGTISSGLFLRHASELEQEYLSRRPKRYILISQVSVRYFDKLPSFKVGNAAVSFPTNLPSAFLRSRESVINSAKHALHAPPPENYRWVRVAVESKESASAASLALDALHLLLGIWNLRLNSSFRVSHGGRRKAVNTVVLGPIHTVHLSSGKLEREVWWFAPNYCGSIDAKSLGQDNIKHILQFHHWVRRKLLTIKYRDQVQKYIRLYNQSLVENDWSTSYIRLWQVLEAATNTSNGNHKETIRRVAFLYKDRDFHFAFLDHLRTMRNQLVHESAEKETMESNLYFLKNYVEDLLIFHLKQAGQFQNPGEASEFLDLPTSAVDLSKRLNMCKKAIRFRSVGQDG